MSLVVLPRQLVVDSSGDPRSGAKMYIFDAGTTTPRETYTTSALTTEHAHPVVSAATGLFPAVFIHPDGGDYKVVLKDSADVTLYTEDNISALTNPYGPGDVRLAGIVADDATAATANTVALKALLDAAEAGISGTVIFPNATGTSVYYFGVDYIEIRDGVTLDLNGSTLNFSGTYDADMDKRGFLNCIRDVEIKNGTIVVDYDGTSGTNNGSAIQVGARATYPFADFLGEEEDLTTPMGNVRLSNLRITTNNGDTAAILLMGGIHNTHLSNIEIDGEATAPRGIYYEFGQWHYEGGAAGDNNITTHALNLSFRNIRISNMVTSGTASSFEIVGAMSAFVDGLVVEGGNAGVNCRPGEALYYNMAGTPTAGMQAHVYFRNLNINGGDSTALSLLGSESAAGGYLATDIGALAAGPEAAAQTDLVSFTVDGFSVQGTSVVSGRNVVLRNGTFFGGSASGGLILQDELRSFHFENIQVLSSAGIGIRCQTSTNIYTAARLKQGSILNCFIAGNDTSGITIENADGVYIGRCRFGFDALQDGVAETTQDVAVAVASTANGVVCDSNFVTVQGGATAYTLGGNGDRGCELRAPRNTATFTGNWMVDGVARATSTNIADIANAINTVGKYTGKKVYDTSNTRMLVAQGSATNSTWITVADFGAGDAVVTVTPA
jgi:hypothetical protein